MKQTTLNLHIGDFSKLIANDAVYHEGCHANYMSQRQKLHKEPSAHDLAFQKLINEIEPKLFSGKAYDMPSVLQTFKKKLSENGHELSGEAYTSQKLKTKLLSHYPISLLTPVTLVLKAVKTFCQMRYTTFFIGPSVHVRNFQKTQAP